MQPPERFIVFAAFDSAANAGENVLTFRDMAALPLLGGEGWGEGEPLLVNRDEMMRPVRSRDLALLPSAGVASVPMFDILDTQLAAASEKTVHLRRFL